MLGLADVAAFASPNSRRLSLRNQTARIFHSCSPTNANAIKSNLLALLRSLLVALGLGEALGIKIGHTEEFVR